LTTLSPFLENPPKQKRKCRNCVRQVSGKQNILEQRIHDSGIKYFHECRRITVYPGVDVMIIIFGDFCQFSEKKLAFFSKTNVMFNFFKN
jgi:hypothetical protein